MVSVKDGEILLTGATGFIGQALYPDLVEAGYQVRCGTRNVEAARERWPERKWVYLDLDDGESVAAALEGCRGAYFLVHRMGQGIEYEERETSGAMTFLDAATLMEVDRVVYLGGVKPPGEPSRHLRSRLVTGAILRNGEVSTIELRASMIVGVGSESWKILRDIAMRLPVMLCPKWLRNRTEPVAIDDVKVALVEAMRLEQEGSAWFDIPGPEALTFRNCIEIADRVLGVSPVMIDVPLLSPRISSYWLRLVTGANYELARELVENLRDDLLARDDRFWEIIGRKERIDLEEAIRRALAHDEEPRLPYEQAVMSLMSKKEGSLP